MEPLILRQPAAVRCHPRDSGAQSPRL